MINIRGYNAYNYNCPDYFLHLFSIKNLSIFKVLLFRLLYLYKIVEILYMWLHTTPPSANVVQSVHTVSSMVKTRSVNIVFFNFLTVNCLHWLVQFMVRCINLASEPASIHKYKSTNRNLENNLLYKIKICSRLK